MGETLVRLMVRNPTDLAGCTRRNAIFRPDRARESTRLAFKGEINIRVRLVFFVYKQEVMRNWSDYSERVESPVSISV